MKNPTKGSATVIVAIIIGLLAVGGWAYYLGTRQVADTAPEEVSGDMLEVATTTDDGPKETTKPAVKPMPKTEGEAGWETYADSRYRFAIKHPSGTKLHVVEISGGHGFSFSTLPSMSGDLTIHVHKETWKGGALAAPASCLETSFDRNTQISRVSLGGKEFLTADVSNVFSGMHSNQKVIEYCIENDGIAYAFYLRRNSDDPVVNQMIASLEFLN